MLTVPIDTRRKLMVVGATSEALHYAQKNPEKALVTLTAAAGYAASAATTAAGAATTAAGAATTAAGAVTTAAVAPAALVGGVAVSGYYYSRQNKDEGLPQKYMCNDGVLWIPEIQCQMVDQDKKMEWAAKCPREFDECRRSK